MVQLVKQVASIRLEVTWNKLDHTDILNTSLVAIKFKIKAVHGLLTTSANAN